MVSSSGQPQTKVIFLVAGQLGKNIFFEARKKYPKKRMTTKIEGVKFKIKQFGGIMKNHLSLSVN